MPLHIYDHTYALGIATFTGPSVYTKIQSNTKIKLCCVCDLWTHYGLYVFIECIFPYHFNK